jgi:DNA polymerase
MLDRTKQSQLLAFLDWCRQMGADQAFADTPTNWMDRGDLLQAPKTIAAKPPQNASLGPPVGKQKASGREGADIYAIPPQRIVPALGSEPIMAARSAARAAGSLEQLASTLAGFEGCNLKAMAKNLCFYRGATKARVMFIGEAPGREEDLEGKPFVGRAGQLLDKMLDAISLAEKDIHITNVVYWRPPGNRTPTPQEAQVCRPFLERQIELVGPELIVLLGGAAAKHLLDVTEGILRIRGKLRDIRIGGHSARALATLHPAYLLRTPAAKRLAWRDLLSIKLALAASEL